MSKLQYLKLQPLEPTTTDDDDTSDLDTYLEDEVIDLSTDTDSETLNEKWDVIVHDIEKDPTWFKFDNS